MEISATKGYRKLVTVLTAYILSQNMDFRNTAMRWLNLEYVVSKKITGSGSTFVSLYC